MNSNKPNRKFIISTSLYFIPILMTSWVINRSHWSDTLPPFLEGIFCLFIINCLLLYEPLQDYFLKIPLPHKNFFLALIFCLTVGQFSGKVKATFPFIPWQMYSRAEPTRTAVFYELIGEYPSGQMITINPAQLFPTLAHGRLSIGLDNLMKSIEKQENSTMSAVVLPVSDEPEKSARIEGFSYMRIYLKHFASTIRSIFQEEPVITLDEKKKHVSELLQALGQMYNRQHLGKPIDHIIISRGSVNVDENPIPDITKKAVWRLEIKTKGQR